MISAIFFLDVKGRTLIFRDYRGDVSPKYAEKFMSKINEAEENAKLSPVILDEGGVTYVYLQVRRPRAGAGGAGPQDRLRTGPG